MHWRGAGRIRGHPPDRRERHFIDGSCGSRFHAGVKAGEADSGAVTPIERFRFAADLVIHPRCRGSEQAGLKRATDPAPLRSTPPSHLAL